MHSITARPLMKYSQMIYISAFCNNHNNYNNNNNNINNDNRIQRRNLRFFTISSLHRQPSATPTLKWPGRNHVQITCNTSSAYHMQHVVLHATWYEGTVLLLSLTEFKSHLFDYILLAKPLSDEDYSTFMLTALKFKITFVLSPSAE